MYANVSLVSLEMWNLKKVSPTFCFPWDWLDWFNCDGGIIIGLAIAAKIFKWGYFGALVSPEEMTAAPGPASIPLWAEVFSKHRTVKCKQTNEGFIDFPPLDSQAPAPLLPHIIIHILPTVMP